MVDEVYKINGVTICPANSQWVGRQVLGVQGDGRPLYPATRAVVLRWEFQSYEEWANVQALFAAIQTTGTLVYQGPAFPTAAGQSYGFTEYSGVYISEPEIGEFFVDHPSSMVLVVTNIFIPGA